CLGLPDMAGAAPRTRSRSLTDQAGAMRARTLETGPGRWFGPPMEINGLAHVMLTPANFERSLPFYRKLLPFLGLVPLLDDGESIYYCIGGRPAIGIQRRGAGDASARVVQRRVGPHPPRFKGPARGAVAAAH